MLLRMLAIASIAALCFFTAVGAVTPVVAQSVAGQNVGLIDMRAIEKNALAWQDLRRKVKARFESFEQKREEIRKREQELRIEQQELAQQQAILSAEAFEQKKKEFEQKLQKLRLEFMSMTKALEDVHKAGESQIIKELQQVILEIAEEEDLRLIINYAEGQGTIVMWRGERNLNEFAITDKAMERLNQRLKTVTLPDAG